MKKFTLLLLGCLVSIVTMAYNLPQNSNMYFVKSDGWTADYCVFMIGRQEWSNDWSTAYTMTKIQNTNLYYVCVPNWDGYNHWAVFNTTKDWGSNQGEGKDIPGRKNGEVVKDTWIGKSELKSYNLIPLESIDATTGNSHTFLNHAQTVELYVAETESPAGGTISASSYELTAANTAAKSTGTTSVSAAYTATVTFTATPNTGYEFVGWYDGNTELSTNTTYTYTAENSTKTINAKFIELAAETPQIKTFTASATEIDLGEQVTFTIETENAGENKVVLKCGETEIANPWTPTAAGTYTVTASLEGAISKSLEIKVYDVLTIKFDNSKSLFKEVYVFCWTEHADKNAEWPGIKLENPVEELYTYTFKTLNSSIYSNVIFNDNDGVQTADLIFKKDSTYQYEYLLTLAGDAAICGSGWDAGAVVNDLTWNADTKKYTKIIAAHKMVAGTYYYKFVKNHDWEKGSFGDPNASNDDKNAELVISKAGNYDLVFTFDPATKQVSATATEVVYYLSYTGKSKAFSGDEYAIAYETNIENPTPAYFVKTPDAEEFIALQSDKYTPAVAGDYIFRVEIKVDADTIVGEKTVTVVAPITAGSVYYLFPNGDWKLGNERYAAYYWDLSGNSVWVDGVVEGNLVKFTTSDAQPKWEGLIFCRMNANIKENGWDPENVADENKKVWNQTGNLFYSVLACYSMPQAEWFAEITYTLVGDVPCFAEAWNNLTSELLVEGSDGVWTKTYYGVNLLSKNDTTYSFKVVTNGSWDYPSYGYESGNATFTVDTAGKYDITFTFDPATTEAYANVVPASGETTIDNVSIDNIYVFDRTIVAEQPITIYTVTGQNVTNQNGRLNAGIYIVRTPNTALKIVVK